MLDSVFKPNVPTISPSRSICLKRITITGISTGSLLIEVNEQTNGSTGTEVTEVTEVVSNGSKKKTHHGKYPERGCRLCGRRGRGIYRLLGKTLRDNSDPTNVASIRYFLSGYFSVSSADPRFLPVRTISYQSFVFSLVLIISTPQRFPT